VINFLLFRAGLIFLTSPFINRNLIFFLGLMCVALSLVANVLALGEEADFEALNSLQELNLIRSTKLHLSTEPAFLPNAC